MEKTKIYYDTLSNRFIQIIDPIYKDLDHPNKVMSFNAHLYADYKYMFGFKVTTFSFNLLVIWLINILLFIVLFFDLLKKTLSLNLINKKNKP